MRKKELFFWILSKLPPPLPPTWTTRTTSKFKIQDLKNSLKFKLGDVHILRNTNLGSQETPHKSSKRKTFFTLFTLFKYKLLKQ